MIEDTSIEVRVLPMPDGTFRPFSGYPLLWHTLDYIQEIYDIETEWLVNLTHINMEEIGYNFEESFPNIVAYVCEKYDANAEKQRTVE